MALSRGIRIHQYLDDWLIRAQSPEESSQHKSGGRPNQISRLDDKSGQIGVDSNSSILFCGIRIPSKLSPCKTHSGEVAKTTGINPQDNQPVCPDCKTFGVSHWVASINRKNGPRRDMRPFQWHLKENWTFPQSLGKLLPWSDSIIAHLDW